MQSSLAVLVVALVGLSASAGPAVALEGGATTGGPTPQSPAGDWQSVTNDSTADVPTVSERGGGRYRIHVSTGDPEMLVDLDLSLLQSPLDPGALTMSTVGSIADERVVSVAVGVRFEGVEDPWTFVQNPFDRFEFVSRSELSLPFPTTVPEITDSPGAAALTPTGGQGSLNTSADGSHEKTGEGS